MSERDLGMEKKILDVIAEIEKLREENEELAEHDGFKVVFKDLSSLNDKLEKLEKSKEEEKMSDEDEREIARNIIDVMKDIYEQAEKNLDEDDLNEIKHEIALELLKICSEKLDEQEEQINALKKENAELRKKNWKAPTIPSVTEKELKNLHKIVGESSDLFSSVHPDLVKLHSAMRESYKLFNSACDKLNELGIALGVYA